MSAPSSLFEFLRRKGRCGFSFRHQAGPLRDGMRGQTRNCLRCGKVIEEVDFIDAYVR